MKLAKTYSIALGLSLLAAPVAWAQHDPAGTTDSTHAEDIKAPETSDQPSRAQIPGQQGTMPEETDRAVNQKHEQEPGSPSATESTRGTSGYSTEGSDVKSASPESAAQWQRVHCDAAHPGKLKNGTESPKCRGFQGSKTTGTAGQAGAKSKTKAGAAEKAHGKSSTQSHPAGASGTHPGTDKTQSGTATPDEHHNPDATKSSGSDLEDMGGE